MSVFPAQCACAEGGPRSPISLALRLLSTQEWRFGGWRGGPHTICWGLNSFFCYLDRHAKVKKHTVTLSGRKLHGRKEKEYACAKGGVLTYPYLTFASLRSFAARRFWGSWKERKKEKERIMPSLVATTSAQARTKCMRTHSVRTN